LKFAQACIIVSRSRGVVSDEAIPAITGEAKLALDSGNTLFRAKAYDRALGR